MAMNYQAALVTGAASGLGRLIAQRLASEGVAVAGIDLQEAPLKALADEIANAGGRFAWAIGDVTQPADLKAKVAAFEQQLGPVDLLVASAGVGMETSGLNYDAETINKVLGVNLLGVSNSIAAVLPGMMQRRRGHIVGLSSLASFYGIPRMLAYCASKSGLNALLEGLRIEMKPFNITVTTVCPGWIRTPMTQLMVGRIPMLEPEVAVERILRAIRRRERVVAFPPKMLWSLRLLRWSPGFVADWLMGRLQRKHGPSAPAVVKP